MLSCYFLILLQCFLLLGRHFTNITDFLDCHGLLVFAGKLTLSQKLDRESISTLNVTILATDNGAPPLSSNITLHINVTDANDNDPVFQNTTYIFNVPENAQEGKEICKFLL